MPSSRKWCNLARAKATRKRGALRLLRLRATCLFSRGSPEVERAQRLSWIEADGAANPQIIHDVEAAFAAFELGNLRLIGSERARQVPLGQARCSAVALEHRDDGAVFAIEFVA